MSIRFRSNLLAGSLLAGAMAIGFGAASASAQVKGFDIPAEPAPKAIAEFARQSGLQIVAPTGQLNGVITPALNGTFDARAALRRLLANTGLEVSSDNGSVIVLRPGTRVSYSLDAQEAPVPSAVSAQSASAVASAQTTDRIEEVVVTAQKRSENLQNVPIAVTVVSGDSMEAQGIHTNLDLDQIVPGLNMTRAIGIDELPFIRGIGTTQQGVGVETPVATYVDGVYIYSQAGAAISLPDIDQVAVLKGPQGTLFGRNTVGGLIQYTTKAPSHNTQIDADAGFGNLGSYLANFYGTTGLTDQIAVSLAANYNGMDQGFGHNLGTGQWVFTHRQAAFRAKLLWQPDSKTDITLSSDYSDFAAAEPVNRIIGNRTILGVPEPGGPFDEDVNFQPYVRVKGGGDSLTIKRDLGFASLVSVTAYRFERTANGFDADGTTDAIQQNYGQGMDDTESQEIQLISPDTGKFSWTAGLFYMAAQNWNGGGVNCSDNDYSAGFGFNPVTHAGGPVAQYQYIPCTSSWSAGSGHTPGSGLWTVAGYGQGTYHIDPATNFTAGFRYSYDYRYSNQTYSYCAAGSTAANCIAAGGLWAPNPGSIIEPSATASPRTYHSKTRHGACHWTIASRRS